MNKRIPVLVLAQVAVLLAMESSADNVQFRPKFTISVHVKIRHKIPVLALCVIITSCQYPFMGVAAHKGKPCQAFCHA